METTEMRNKYVWHACCVLAVLLSVVAFTPLVIPYGVAEPTVLGMPRTMWAGLLVSFGLLSVTILGAWASGYQDEGDTL